MMKLDFQRAVLNRVPEIAKIQESIFESFLRLRRISKLRYCWRKRANRRREVFQPLAPAQMHPDCGTQSISSLKSVLARRDLANAFCNVPHQDFFSRFQTTFRPAPPASSAGGEDRLKVSYNISESGHDARVSLLTGKAIAHRANVTASQKLQHADRLSVSI